jgi:hypothetical protein
MEEVQSRGKSLFSQNSGIYHLGVHQNQYGGMGKHLLEPGQEKNSRLICESLI